MLCSECVQSALAAAKQDRAGPVPSVAVIGSYVTSSTSYLVK